VLCYFCFLDNSKMDTTTRAAELHRRFGIPGLVQVCEGNGGLPRVRITGPHGKGEVYLYGAHVTSWRPKGFDDVVYVSSKARWQEGQAIRGGIPVCFPWFRGKADDPKAPAHGFARTRMWQLESIVESNGRVSVTMFTESDDQTRRWWPAEFRLVHRVSFGSELKKELVCTNAGTSPLRFEEALHTYNRVANVQDTRVQGLDGAHYLDNTNSNLDKVQQGDVAIASQTDNAYLSTRNAVDLIDPGMQRRIRLTKENSLNTVVWNPWREKASEMKDLGDGEWAQFLCVEACNIRDAAITLAPGQEHKMTAIVSVAKL
jgi:glucose-6-phosphate 1-epimerase